MPRLSTGDPARVEPFLDRIPHLRRVLLEHLKPDSCITMSRLLRMLLRAEGLDAREAPVEARIANAAAASCLGGSSDPQVRSGAYIVTIGDPDHPRPGGWTGHLVVQCEGLLIDASIDQASRPQRGIHLDVPLAVRLPTGFEEDGATLRTTVRDGVLVEYTHRPRNTSYLQTPSWRKAPQLLPVARREWRAAPDA